jgi:hypothetical protein
MVAPERFGFFNIKGVSIPVAVNAFPDELYQAPRSWAERAYPNGRFAEPCCTRIRDELIHDSA